jgi:DNA polymerase
MITLDFETYYDKEFSLSKITTEQYIRDERFEVIGVGVKVDNNRTTWFSGTKQQIQEHLDGFDIPNNYLLCHHTAFDGAILAWHFGIIPKYYVDTLSMVRPITGQSVGGSLAKASEYFGLGKKGTEVIKAIGKHRLDFQFSELHEYGDYCINDVELTYALFQKLKPLSTNKEMYIIDLMIRMYTDPVLQLDKEVLLKHLTNVQDKKQALMDKIDSEIGRENLMSNPKFAEVLKNLGIDPPMKISPATGKETYAFGKTDVGFKALLDHEDERVQAVVSARFGIKSTLEETRTESFIKISERGSLPILLNYYGAHTGRASGGDKINLQNLPRGGELRQAIKAPEGHKLVAVDSSQIEARVVAWLAGEAELLQAFSEGRDIYSEFASEVYEKRVTKSDKVERFVGKTCILGLGYGMGKDKFKTTLKIGQAGVSVDIELPIAEKIVTLYRTKYAHIAKLWKEGDEALNAIQNGFDFYLGSTKLLCNSEGVHLPNGMKVQYKNLRRGRDGFEYDSRYGPVKIYGGKLIENIVQALARIVVFDQMAKIDMAMRRYDKPHARFRVALTVHDEVVVVCPELVESKVLDYMIKVMSQPPSWAPDLPVACEGSSGNNYAECK